MRRYESVAGLTVGASGSDSTIPIPANRRLHMARLYAYGVAAGPVDKFGADVLGDLQFYVGTRLVRNLTAAEALDIAKLNGKGVIPSATVGLPIYFTEPWRASVMDEQVPAWDLFQQEGLTIKARTQAALTGVTLKTVLTYDDGFTTIDTPQGKQRVLNIIKQEPINLGSLGTSADILNPVIPVDLPIQRILIYPAAGVTINSAKVTVNESNIVFDMTQAENINALADYGMVAEAGNGKVFPIVFDMNQQLFDGLPVSRSIKLHIEQSGAGVVKLVMERRAPNYSV